MVQLILAAGAHAVSLGALVMEFANFALGDKPGVYEPGSHDETHAQQSNAPKFAVCQELSCVSRVLRRCEIKHLNLQSVVDPRGPTCRRPRRVDRSRSDNPTRPSAGMGDK